jgi:hypothetical protein
LQDPEYLVSQNPKTPKPQNPKTPNKSILIERIK